MADGTKPRRTRVERGIYRQANGNLAVCTRRAGRPLPHRRHRPRRYRRAREDLISALEKGWVPASPRLRFDTVAARWCERFEAMVAAGDLHPRTLEAHRLHLDHDLLPRLGSRRVSSFEVEDVADLIIELRAAGRSAKTTPTPWRPYRVCCASLAAAARSDRAARA
jgi:hypothetical protein